MFCIALEAEFTCSVGWGKRTLEAGNSAVISLTVSKVVRIRCAMAAARTSRVRNILS